MKHIGPLTLVALLLPLAPAHAEDVLYRGVLVGSQEVPVVLTAASGGFRARLSPNGTSLMYELAYTGLEGSITQAHIHIGQGGANGGIAVWLCSNLASPPTPAGVQACPPSPGQIHGVITAAEVVGPLAQGVSPNEFAALVLALRRGLAYANVHTDISPGGEIRSQLNHSGQD